jgi:dipeptidyl aminopeptidase/acylaminoacyl peptidase
VVFASFRNASASVLFQKAASGAGDEQPLPATGEYQEPLAWSPDGYLLYAIRHPKTGADLWALPMAGDRKPLPILQTPADETAGQFSPDGRWVAYQSNESKPAQIYVQPFRGPGGPWQVSTAGGSQPRWRPDGKELFYVAADARLMAVPIAVGADPSTLKAGAPVPRFRTRLVGGANISGVRPQYAVASDGQRFLMNVSVEGTTAPPITVVLNWDVPLKK